MWTGHIKCQNYFTISNRMVSCRIDTVPRDALYRVKIIVSLKSGLGVVQGHWKKYRQIGRIQGRIRVLY